ncbi:MAG: hypothetical protein RLP13_01355, partial [Cytophagales bacterium]
MLLKSNFNVIYFTLALVSSYISFGQTTSQKSSVPFTILDSMTLFNPPNQGSILKDPVYTGTEFWFRSTNLLGGLDSVYIFSRNGLFQSSFLLPGNKTPRSIVWDGLNIWMTRNSSINTEIYKIDTANKLVISTHLLSRSYATMAFDPSANAGNGGIWALSFSTPRALYLLDSNFFEIDSIEAFQLPNSIFYFTVDTSTYANSHFILSRTQPGLRDQLLWYDITTKSLSNNNYYNSQDIGFCDVTRGISTIYDTSFNNSNTKLMSLSSNWDDTLNRLIIYELGPPPPFPAPINDDICGALEIKLDSPSIFFNNLEATSSPNEPIGSCFTHPVDSSVWFKVVVTNPSFYVQQGPDSPNTPCNPAINDYQIAAYDLIGNGCQALPVQIGCGDENGGPWGTFARTT